MQLCYFVPTPIFIRAGARTIVIISGLQDFDGNSLSYEQYYALAIEGLWESDIYQNINSNYNSWSEYNSAKNSAIGASNQNCTN